MSLNQYLSATNLLFCNDFNRFNDIWARMQDTFYHMTSKLGKGNRIVRKRFLVCQNGTSEYQPARQILVLELKVRTCLTSLETLKTIVLMVRLIGHMINTIMHYNDLKQNLRVNNQQRSSQSDMHHQCTLTWWRPYKSHNFILRLAFVAQPYWFADTFRPVITCDLCSLLILFRQG